MIFAIYSILRQQIFVVYLSPICWHHWI